MRRIIMVLAVAAVVAAMLVLTASSALAQEGPKPNDNNCAGVVVSSLAGPSFGPLVASVAHLQAVDNFNFASCGDNPRKNP